MLKDLTIDKCQNRASRYRTWTKTNVQGTKGRLRANITQWKLSLGCNK